MLFVGLDQAINTLNGNIYRSAPRGYGGGGNGGGEQTSESFVEPVRGTQGYAGLWVAKTAYSKTVKKLRMKRDDYDQYYFFQAFPKPCWDGSDTNYN